MAKATTKKNTAKTSTPKTVKTVVPSDLGNSFEVTITIKAPFSALTKGIVYTAQTITTISTAKNEQAAVNKSLRSFGLAHRTDVKYDVASRAVPTPNV